MSCLPLSLCFQNNFAGALMTTAGHVPHLKAREAIPNLFLKLEQVPPSDVLCSSSRELAANRVEKPKKNSRSARKTMRLSLIQNLNTLQVKVHMKVIMKSLTLMRRSRTHPPAPSILMRTRQSRSETPKVLNQDELNDIRLDGVVEVLS